MLSVDAGFEVQVFGCGTSGASGQGNGLSGTDSIAAMDQVLDVVAVDGFQPESVAYDDDIAVGAVVFCHPHDTIEGTTYRISGTCFDVDAAVSSPATLSVGRDDFAAG